VKAWHKPLDPHHYQSSLRGALAVPMLARGRLLGVILLDERPTGEAYAPDEVDAMMHVAHGVASALDGLDAPPLDGDIRSRLDEIRSLLVQVTERNP
jgi:signal transduction protein with GAF and PtsI domain